MFEELSNISPFPDVLEALKILVTRGRGELRMVSILERETEEYVCPCDKPVELPPIIVHYVAVEEPYFFITLYLNRIHTTPFGDSAEICLKKSRYYHLFQELKDEFGICCAFYAALPSDYDMAARFVTYYMQIYGYSSPDDWSVSTSCALSKGTESLPQVELNKTIPAPLRKAFEKARELRLTEDDAVILFMYGDECENTPESLSFFIDFDNGKCHISSEALISEEAFERRRQYRWADNIAFIYRDKEISEYLEYRTKSPDQLMQFLTDYFMFINPHMKAENISAGLSFDAVAAYDETNVNPYEDWNYYFHADGTESSPEMFAKCMDVLKRYREVTERKMNELGLS